eukprot:TRINITY_DN13478_c0_g1_i1.p2 TRINITY_DN13478_c0_g1~~TRINITY_DN13478_c0_g1_i1.p2  ORF type:complete len:116 (-),score=77.16 TRINITY_DN13478_c0_g1_i1:83-430(-)
MSTATEVFTELSKKLFETPDIVSKVKVVYQWHITDGTQTKESWIMDLKNGSGSITKGTAEKADCTLTLTEADFLALIAGKLNPQQAFFQKKLKIAGNIMLSQKLSVVLNANKAKL